MYKRRAPEFPLLGSVLENRSQISENGTHAWRVMQNVIYCSSIGENLDISSCLIVKQYQEQAK